MLHRNRQDRVIGLLAAVVLGTASPAAAQRHARLISRIDSLAAETLGRGPAAGLAIAVQRGNERILARGYGYGRLADSVPATELTRFPVGSITKIFTAAAVLRLAQQKKLRLKDDIASYLTGLPRSDPPITIQHLLNHTSGFPMITTVDSGASADPIPPDEVYRLLRNAPPEAKPGERFEYSNAGYYLLGLIVEQVTGRAFFEHLSTDLFDTLQMVRTGDCLSGGDLATGYDSAGAAVPPAMLENAPAYAAAGACSSVVDLLAWSRAIQETRVVNRFFWNQMTEATELEDGARVSYGLGVFLGQLGRHRSVTHGGARPGFSSHLAFYPDARLTVAVLANSEQAPTRRLADQIARRVLGVIEPEIKDRALTAAEMERYAGEYDLAPHRLRVFPGVRRLRAVIGTGGELELLYQGSHEFVSEADPTLRFVFRMSGDIAGSVLFRAGDLDMVAKRLLSAP